MRRLAPRLIAGAVIVAAGLAMLAPTLALGYIEPNPLSGTGCGYCHPSVWVDPPGYMDIQRRPDVGGDCDACHTPYARDVWTGPHGGYTASTDKCDACHTVHDGLDGAEKLLPAVTVVGACFTCHDGTGGYGPYGTIEAITGTAPSGGHSVETTSMIPGGDAVTGGGAARTFDGPSGTLICTDCHSPHANDMVDAFKGDRRRVRASAPSPTTSRLLRRQPTGATTATAEYGSDWCLGCHAGRVSGGAVHNHPVESSATVATPYTYGNVPILASDDPTAVTTVREMGGVNYTASSHWPSELDNAGNRGYLMPYPRTAQQSGHYPICMQCHEDSRSVGSLTGDGSIGDAATATISAADGVYWSSGWTTATADNPQFQNFPHETLNSNMLVETADDLCLNCHPVGGLP